MFVLFGLDSSVKETMGVDDKESQFVFSLFFFFLGTTEMSGYKKLNFHHFHVEMVDTIMLFFSAFLLLMFLIIILFFIMDLFHPFVTRVNGLGRGGAVRRQFLPLFRQHFFFLFFLLFFRVVAGSSFAVFTRIGIFLEK